MKNLPINEDDGNWDEDARLLFVNTPFFTSTYLCSLYLSLLCPWFAFLSSISISRSSPVSSILWCYCLCFLVLSVCICSLCVLMWLLFPCLWIYLLSLVHPIFLPKAPHLCAFWFSILCLFLYPPVRVSQVFTEKRRLLLLWQVHAHSAQFWLLELEEACNASPQRGSLVLRE
jgi:hypothetical protein